MKTDRVNRKLLQIKASSLLKMLQWLYKARQLSARFTAWLMCFFVLILSFDLRADEEQEIWQFASNESLLSVRLSSEDGNLQFVSGSGTIITARSVLTTWEVWINNFGSTEIRNVTETDANNASFTWSSSSDNSLTAITSSVAGNEDYRYFDMGGEDADVTVTIDLNSVQATSTIHMTHVAAPEIWAFSRSEGSLSLSIVPVNGTSEMQPGATRQVLVHSDFITWDVYMSDLGNTMAQNYQTAPASGGSVALQLEGADGALADTFLVLDGEGNATTVFTFGNSAATITGTSSYAYTSQSAAASLQFVPSSSAVEETWAYDHTEGSIDVVWSVLDPVTLELTGLWLDTNETRLLRPTVTYTSWEIWHSNLGNIQERNRGTAPAIGAALSFGASGPGVLAGTYALANADGQVDNLFTMGEGNPAIYVNVAYAGCTAYSELAINWLNWHLDHENMDISVTWAFLNEAGEDMVGQNIASGTVVSLVPTVTYSYNERWTNNWGAVQTRNASSGPLSGVEVQFAKGDGDGQLDLTQTSLSTGTDGKFLPNTGATLTLGTEANHIYAYVGNLPCEFTLGPSGQTSNTASYSSGNTTAVIEDTLGTDPNEGTDNGTNPPVYSPWVLDHSEAEISVSVVSSDGQDSSSANLEATVTRSSWQVWKNILTDDTEERSFSSSPAIGAQLVWSVASGDATLGTSSSATTTGGTSTISVTRGSETSTISVSAAYLSLTMSDSADIDPTPQGGGGGGNDTDTTNSGDPDPNQTTQNGQQGQANQTNTTTTSGTGGSGGSFGWGPSTPSSRIAQGSFNPKLPFPASAIKTARNAAIAGAISSLASGLNVQFPSLTVISTDQRAAVQQELTRALTNAINKALPAKSVPLDWEVNGTGVVSNSAWSAPGMTANVVGGGTSVTINSAPSYAGITLGGSGTLSMSFACGGVTSACFKGPSTANSNVVQGAVQATVTITVSGSMTVAGVGIAFSGTGTGSIPGGTVVSVYIK